MCRANSTQLSVQLLGFLIARGAKVKQKQMQRFLEFVYSVFPFLALVGVTTSTFRLL